MCKATSSSICGSGAVFLAKQAGGTMATCESLRSFVFAWSLHCSLTKTDIDIPCVLKCSVRFRFDLRLQCEVVFCKTTQATRRVGRKQFCLWYLRFLVLALRRYHDWRLERVILLCSDQSIFCVVRLVLLQQIAVVRAAPLVLNKL